MKDSSLAKLKAFLQSGQDWERLPTTVPGITVVRMPPRKKGGQPELSIEILPLGRDGQPIRFRGLFVKTEEQVRAFQEVLTSPKLNDLAIAVQKINDAHSGHSNVRGGLEL